MHIKMMFVVASMKIFCVGHSADFKSNKALSASKLPLLWRPLSFSSDIPKSLTASDPGDIECRPQEKKRRTFLDLPEELQGDIRDIVTNSIKASTQSEEQFFKSIEGPEWDYFLINLQSIRDQLFTSECMTDVDLLNICRRMVEKHPLTSNS